jgi:acyl-CoA thioesterase
MVAPPSPPMVNPFAELVGFVFEPSPPLHSTSRLRLEQKHLNPHTVVHGAVLFAMADTGMGAALYPTLGAHELCATIEIKITYFKAIAAGELVCRTQLVNRGKRVAYLESSISSGEALLAKATGTYAIFQPSKRAP